jgi:hypothetical protein
MKRVADMCPFMGLSYEDENRIIHTKGEGLSDEENCRLDKYFGRYVNKSFLRPNSIRLAQLALDNLPVPEDFDPHEEV